MAQLLRFDEDMHIHSVFSDGRDTMEDNLASARQVGLKRICCVDHVRNDTGWIPEFVAEVRRLDRESELRVQCGVEAKLVDTQGHVDVPPDLHLADFLYVADHQFPTSAGCVKPRDVRRALCDGSRSRADVLTDLFDAYHRALERHRNVVLAHVFSILPKIGLREDDVPDANVIRLGQHLAATKAKVEFDERWRCPGARVLRLLHQQGVELIASTDSHRKETIGKYPRGAAVAAELGAQA